MVSLEFKENQWGAEFPGGARAFCSGVVIAADRILTNRHCVEADPNRQLWVRFKDGKLVKDILVFKTALPDDAAVLSVDPREVLAIAAIRKTPVAPGEEVFAVGAPSGLRWTVTRGTISSVERMLDLDEETAVEISRGPWLQVDAAINPGDSGGPLFDANGFVVGIKTLKLTGTDNIAFSRPIVILLTLVKDYL